MVAGCRSKVEGRTQTQPRKDFTTIARRFNGATIENHGPPGTAECVAFTTKSTESIQPRHTEEHRGEKRDANCANDRAFVRVCEIRAVSERLSLTGSITGFWEWCSYNTTSSECFTSTVAKDWFDNAELRLLL